MTKFGSRLCIFVVYYVLHIAFSVNEWELTYYVLLMAGKAMGQWMHVNRQLVPA